MDQADCPDWEYDDCPGRHQIGTVCGEILRQAASDPKLTRDLLLDTRAAHKDIFAGLTPEGFPHFAGNYRGSPLTCLQGYRVRVPSDSRVGAEPATVAGSMVALAKVLKAGLSALEATAEDRRIPAETRAKAAVAFASRIFVEFLTIHPYVNGNGHIGRLMVWLCLFQCRLTLNGLRWPVDPRPQVPFYSELIYAYRNGNREPLEKFLFESLRLA